MHFNNVTPAPAKRSTIKEQPTVHGFTPRPRLVINDGARPQPVPLNSIERELSIWLGRRPACWLLWIVGETRRARAAVVGAALGIFTLIAGGLIAAFHFGAL